MSVLRLCESKQGQASRIRHFTDILTVTSNLTLYIGTEALFLYVHRNHEGEHGHLGTINALVQIKGARGPFLLCLIQFWDEGH